MICTVLENNKVEMFCTVLGPCGELIHKCVQLNGAKATV